MKQFRLSIALTLASVAPSAAPAGEPVVPAIDTAGAKSGLMATLSDPDADASKTGMADQDLIQPARPASTWSLSIGPAYRHLSGTKYRGGTRSRLLDIPSFVGGDSLYVPPIGPGTEIGDRDYDNGYVYMDGATANDGTTWYWGHASDSQVSDGNLAFNATGAKSLVSGQTLSENSLRDTEDQDATRPLIQLHFINPNRDFHGMRLGFGFSLGEMPLDHNVRFSDYQQVQVRDDYRIDWTDTYDLQGVVPPLAPYNGSLEGPGPIIDNTPTERQRVDVLINTDTAIFTNLITSRFHGSLFTLSLGPTLTHEHRDLSFRATGGGSLSLLNWSGRQSEVNTLAETSGGAITGVSTYQEWQDHRSGVALIPGLFAQAEGIWHFDEAWFASVFARGDLTATTKVDVGPSSYEVDPSGYTIGLSIGRSF